MQRVLVYGNGGALGRAVFRCFRTPASQTTKWQVYGCDLHKSEDNGDHMIIAPIDGLTMAGNTVLNQINVANTNGGGSPEDKFLDAIICVSGGFAMANAANEEFFRIAEDMISSSIHSSLICARIAALHLKRNGMLLLPGAAAAPSPAPQMLAYGCAKAYVHHLVKSLAGDNSGMPTGAKVVAIAPEILDTPGNRAAMAQASRSSLTPLDDLSAKIVSWAINPAQLQNGGIYRITTKEGETSYTLME